MAKNGKTDLTAESLLLGTASPDGVKQLQFEEALKLLESLVGSVESGTLPLEKAVCAYEQGVVLVEHLRGLLSGAEEKLKLLQKAPEC